MRSKKFIATNALDQIAKYIPAVKVQSTEGIIARWLEKRDRVTRYLQ